MPRDDLLRYPLFNLLTPGEVDGWLASSQEVTLQTGETIFQAGTAGVWAYLVLDGQVRVLRAARQREEVTLGLLGAGDVFGEYALLPPGRNTATCRAAGPTRLLRLPLGPLRTALGMHPEVQGNLKNWLRLHTLLGYLRGRTFLGFLSAPSALALLDDLLSMQVAAGQPLQDAERFGDCWFCVVKGRVVLRPAADLQHMVRELGPGDCFGEQALLGRQGEITAVAVEHTECLYLSAAVFQRTNSGHSVSLQTVASHASAGPQHAWVGQEETTDCGLAALAMIARTRGVALPLADLRRAVRLGVLGASLRDLQRVAQSLGLPCQSVRVAHERLAGLKLPVIAHLSGGHYVVVYEQDPARVILGDPDTGIVTVSAALFRRLWSGNLLLFAEA